MRTRTAPSGYSALQIGLHWLIAALVIVQLVFNGDIQDAFEDRMDEGEYGAGLGALIHIVVGVSILLLAAIRVAVRLLRGAPPPHRDNPALIRWISWLTHLLLYGFIIVMPLTGALAWFGGVDLAADIHELGKLILIPLILLHAAGGFVEHFVFRNDTLLRMLKPSGR